MKSEEGPKQVIRNEGHGSGKANSADAHCLGLEKEIGVVVIRKVFDTSSMKVVRSVGSTLPTNCKLSGKQSLKTMTEKPEMMKIPYASAI